MPVPLDDLPPTAKTACVRLRDAVVSILGDDCAGMWLHGGTTFADRPEQPGDLDVCVAVAAAESHERLRDEWRAQPNSRPSRLESAAAAVGADEGVGFDITYLLAEDMRASEIDLAFRRGRPLNCWAVFRAHWLAGQYVHLHGQRPEELVTPPTEADLRRDLDRELEHLERHVFEGDANDPYEATYAIWNGCRILHTLQTGGAAISKRSAGAWGLEHLPERWHAAIRAAGRSYDGRATADDKEVLRVTMPLFVDMVRQHLPPTGPRPPGPPRWS